MTTDDEIPSPPSLPPADDGAYRRAELADALDDGAWADAFDQWREESDIDQDAYDIARELDLFASFDFFWDDIAGRVGFHAPGIADDWEAQSYHPDLDSWRQVSSINASMAEFGQTVCDVLLDAYLDWGDDEWGDDLDLPSFE